MDLLKFSLHSRRNGIIQRAVSIVTELIPGLPRIYDIHLLTAIGLTPGGSSTVHIYTQTVHRKVQKQQYIEQHNSLIRKSAGRALFLRVIPWHLPYN